MKYLRLPTFAARKAPCARPRAQGASGGSGEGGDSYRIRSKGEGFDNIHREGKHRIILAAFCNFDTILKQYRENNEIDIITVNGRGDMKIKRLLFDKNPENLILSKKKPF